MTLSEIKKEVRHLDKNVKDGTEHSITAVILLSSLIVGTNVNQLANFTKYDRAEIVKREKNLRKNKVWVGEKIHVNWFNRRDGGIAFWCDVAVAEGMLKRV